MHLLLGNDNLGTVRTQGANASKDEVRSQVDKRCNGVVLAQRRDSEEEKASNQLSLILTLATFTKACQHFLAECVISFKLL